MRAFIIIWVGQFVSRIGTATTRFALLVWAYEQTGSATAVALFAFCSFVPFILVSPFAGVWVDRVDRRRIMVLADTGAGILTLALLLLYAGGDLHLGHLYLAQALSGVFEAFQVPAYTAASTTLLPKAQYARASGLRSMANFGAQVLAPALGGLLLVTVGLGVVMVLDVLTFAVALITLRIVRVPDVGVRDAMSEPAGQARLQATLRQEMSVGFRYIWERPGLRGMVFIFTGILAFASLTYYSILPAMILARSGGSELALASVQGAIGAGGIVGGLLMSVWGGPARKIHGFLIGAGLSFIAGDLTIAVGQSLYLWVVGAFVGAFFIPIVVSCDLAIWQAKVPPAIQGRVFATYDMLRQSLTPVGYLLGGTLADRWLEPAMMPNGVLTPIFGGLVGVGPGTGMALMFIGTSILGCIMSFSGYLVPSLRRVEGDLPDFDRDDASLAAAQMV